MGNVHTRKFLFAIPYKSAPFGFRMDWSPMWKDLYWYVWWNGGSNYKSGPVRFAVLNNISFHTKCLLCGKRNRRYRYCGGDTGCKSYQGASK